MRTKLKWIGIAALVVLGLLLAIQNPPAGYIPSANTCTAARAIICLQR